MSYTTRAIVELDYGPSFGYRPAMTFSFDKDPFIMHLVFEAKTSNGDWPEDAKETNSEEFEAAEHRTVTTVEETQIMLSKLPEQHRAGSMMQAMLAAMMVLRKSRRVLWAVG